MPATNVVTTPTPVPTNTSVAVPVPAPTTSQPTRASLYREINDLRAELWVGPVEQKETDTIASLQKQVVNLKYGIANPGPADRDGQRLRSSPSSTPIGGDATKSDLVKQIDSLSSALGFGATGIDPAAMNRNAARGTSSTASSSEAPAAAASGDVRRQHDQRHRRHS